MSHVSHAKRTPRAKQTDGPSSQPRTELQQMFDESTRVTAQAKLAETVNSGATVQRKLADAYIYAAHAQLNHKWGANVDDFIELLRELKANGDWRYAGLKDALLRGMPEEEAEKVESALSGGTKFIDMDFPSSDEDDEDFQSEYVLPNSKKIRKTKRKDVGNIKTNKMFGGKTRPSSHGVIEIEKQKIAHVGGEIERPVRVSGLVFRTETKGRPQAPEPSSGIKVGVKWKDVGSKTTRNTGFVDMQKGHLMALELGGPDISSNIVPQFGNWQGNGAWRRAEKRVLELAKEAESRGNRLWFNVDVTYKTYKDVTQGTLKGLLVPTHFKITVTELTKLNQAVGDGTIIFDEDQNRDDTDDRVAFEKLDEADLHEATSEVSDDDQNEEMRDTDMDEG